MQLPALTLPKIDLPFDIPVLLHPPVDHFAIALPVLVLLLEFYNLFAKRKSIGAFSSMLLMATVVVFAMAYLTGLTDGKEAYDMLSPEGQEALKSHKLLGTYLLIGSAIVLLLKFLAMTGKKVLRVLFFLGLIGFMVTTFEQGEHGGELVYKYGANVEKVKDLDDALFDAKDALEDAESESKNTPKEAVSEKAKEVTAAPVQEESLQEKSVQEEPVQEEPVQEEPAQTPQEEADKEETVQNTKAETNPEASPAKTLLDHAKKEMEDTNKKVLDTLQDAASDTQKDVVEKIPVESVIQ